MSDRPGDAYNELCAYTLTHHDAAFIHQHVVDAFAAQHADAQGKPIGVVFALAGLYLHIEKQFTGRQVQQAHMRMGRKKRPWPAIALPADRGSVTVLDVMGVPEGAERDNAIDAWCVSVWDAFSAGNRSTIVELLRQYDLA